MDLYGPFLLEVDAPDTAIVKTAFYVRENGVDRTPLSIMSPYN